VQKIFMILKGFWEELQVLKIWTRPNPEMLWIYVSKQEFENKTLNFSTKLFNFKLKYDK